MLFEKEVSPHTEQYEVTMTYANKCKQKPNKANYRIHGKRSYLLIC